MDNITTQNQNLPDWFDDTLHKVAKNGAIMSRATGRIVSGAYTTNLITPETSAELRRKWTEKKLINKLTGIIHGAGLTIDDSIPDDLSIKSDKASQLLYSHLVKVFLQSDKLDGMSKVIEQLFEKDNTPITKDDNKLPLALIALMNKYMDESTDRTDVLVIDADDTV